MIFKVILTVACLQATVFSFAQTQMQKEMFYERINEDSKGGGILPKIDPIASKEVLFQTAQVLPVYNVTLDATNKVKLTQNKEYYLVFYLGRLYCFLNNKNSRFFENSPIIKNIIQFNKEKKEYFVCYFTDSFSKDDKYLDPLLTDKSVSFIINRGTKYTLLEYIDLKYGSIKKYKEQAELQFRREKLTLNDINASIKNDYKIFENNCPKDTTLLLHTLMNQIRVATKDFTKSQEAKLLERIKQKLDPYKIKEIQLKSALIAAKVDDSTITATLLQSKIEYQKEKKQSIVSEGLYEFTCYGISINNELLEILTNDQFIDYKKYNDLINPVVETLNINNNYKYRYQYSKYFLEKENIIKSNDLTAYEIFIKKIATDCGCLSNETSKKELKLK